MNQPLYAIIIIDTLIILTYAYLVRMGYPWWGLSLFLLTLLPDPQNNKKERNYISPLRCLYKKIWSIISKYL